MPKKRKDGYIKLSFTVNGTRYYVYGRTMQEAREKERLKRQQIAEGIYINGRGLTVDGFYTRWYESRKDAVSGQTLKTNRGLYNVISDMAIDKAGTKFGKLKLMDVERQNVLDLQTALKSAKKKDGKPYSTRTINDMIALIRQLFDTAKIDHLVQWNPADGVKSLKRTEPKARDTLHRALTVEETKAFFAAAAGNWYYPLFLFMISSGCRVGEAGALRLSNVRDGKVYIKATVTRDEYNSRIIGDTTKTAAGERAIPITKDIQEAIDAQKELNNIAFGDVIDINGTIFKSPNGCILNEGKVNDNIRRICGKAGIDRFSSHAFRDTFATRALESGMPPKTLQEILGHSDFSMTMNVYAHVMETTKAEEMERVDVKVK